MPRSYLLTSNSKWLLEGSELLWFLRCFFRSKDKTSLLLETPSLKPTASGKSFVEIGFGGWEREDKVWNSTVLSFSGAKKSVSEAF